MNCSTVHRTDVKPQLHLITFLPHPIHGLKLFPGNKYATSPNKAAPWHQGFLFILQLRKGSFISLLQEEIFLISQASIQLHTFLRRPFPGTNYPVLQPSHYHENFQRNSTLEDGSNHGHRNLISVGRQASPKCRPPAGLQIWPQPETQESWSSGW